MYVQLSWPGMCWRTASQLSAERVNDGWHLIEQRPFARHFKTFRLPAGLMHETDK